MTAHRLLLLLAVVALPLQSLDDAVRADVRATRRPWLERPMRIASDDARPVLAAGLVFAALSGAAGRAFALESLVALAPVNLVVEAGKRLVDRHRPSGPHDTANAAFPSSHAANAFAIAVLVARRWRRWAVPAFLLAIVVAWSRLYLDRHWFTDVAAGALVGAFLAAWTASAWTRWRASRAAPPEIAA